ncbi:MAG TPA: hypothetical protein VG273_04790 [Bryobacteraceae bacterium]|jgi:hypothetical protein|nr:hypothetical protein [Bryobacteraceae bacterium]
MRGRLSLLLLLAVSGFAAPCSVRHPVTAGDTLAGLATFYYGSADFAPAILIGTNSRVREGFAFISNPFQLRKGDLCIPDGPESELSRATYAVYQKAIAATSFAEPTQEVRDLVVIPEDRPVTVATWTRAEQAGKFRDKTPGDTWVTVEPYLKEFCSAYGREHKDLAERLEQRLGLPPAAGQDTFVRFRLAKPGRKTIFRPCSDPSVSAAHCEAGPPSGGDAVYSAWFMGQYYSAFGLPRPNLYPWTALGYTFDWARGEDGEFKRVGESEFVVPKGTPVEVLGTISTEEYCR